MDLQTIRKILRQKKIGKYIPCRYYMEFYGIKYMELYGILISRKKA